MHGFGRLAAAPIMGLVRFRAPLAGEVGPRQVQTSEHGHIDWKNEDDDVGSEGLAQSSPHCC